MGLSRLSLILVLGTALTASEAAPDPKDKKAKSEAGATVTVTAEGREVPLDKTPNPVKVVAMETLDAHRTQTLSELVADLLPGQVAPYGGAGTLTSLFLNGSRSKDTVVTLDGIRLNDSGGLGVNLSQIGLGGVDRVEILTGPATTLHGSDAHGGVMALYSPGTAKEGFTGQAGLGIGTRGQERGTFAGAYGFSKGWVRASVDGENADAPTETPNPFSRSQVFAGVGFTPTENHLLTLNHHSQHQRTPLPYNWDWSGNRIYSPARESKYDQDVTTFSWQATWMPQITSEVHAGQVEGTDNYSDGSWLIHSRRRQVNGRLTWVGSRVSVTGLADQWSDRAWNADPGAATTGKHVAGALEVAYEPTDRLRLVASGRQQLDKIGQEKSGQPEASFHQFTWKAGLNLRASETLRLYASMGTSFNTPDLYTIQTNLGQKRDLPGNEESRSTLAGITWEQKGWKARLEANRIQYTSVNIWTGTWPTGYYMNQQGIRVQGVEASGGYSTADWSAEAFVRNQEGRDTKAPEDKALRIFSGRPFTSWGARGTLRSGSLRLAGRLGWSGHHYAYNSDLAGTAAVKQHFLDASLEATWAVSPTMDLTLRGDHLLTSALTQADWIARQDVGRNNTAFLPGFLAQPRAFSLEARYRF